jgi:hypothetical protein
VTLYAFDAAYSPDLAKVAAAGGIAVNGYLTGKFVNTTTQPAAALAAGLGFIPTYEEAQAELVGASRATGQAVGNKIAAAFRAKGLPDDGSIAVYPSVDVNVGNAAACDQAFRGIKDVLGNGVSLRCYSEGIIIDRLVAAGLVDGKCWLAAPTSWPGYNASDGNVCMVQQVGQFIPGYSTDRNLITDVGAIGAYWPAGSPFAGSSQGGFLMALTDAEQAEALGILRDLHQAVSPGQTTAGGTLAAILPGVQAALNKLNQLAGNDAALQAAIAKITPAGQPGPTFDPVAFAHVLADHVKLVATP